MSKKYDNNLNEIKETRTFATNTTIDSKDLGTLGVYFEREMANKKIEELKQQLAEKNKEMQEWKDGTMIVKYEQQLAEKDKEITMLKSQNQFFMEETKRLDQISNLKDKEIERLNNLLADADDELEEIEKVYTEKCKWLDKKYQELIEEDIKDQRHQICEEIREWCERNEFEVENADQSSDSVIYTYKQLFKKLDKIEKGD